MTVIITALIITLTVGLSVIMESYLRLREIENDT